MSDLDENRERPGSEPLLLKCPVCSVPTDSLKSYRVLYRIYFFLIGAFGSRLTGTACPKCMRRMLLKITFSPLNILFANLCWIFGILPYHSILMLLTLLPGHSVNTLKAVELEKQRIAENNEAG